MSRGRPLSELIGSEISPNSVIIWRQIPDKAIKWLERLFQTAALNPITYRDAIPFSIFRSVFEADLDAARNLGPTARYSLIQILAQLYREESQFADAVDDSLLTDSIFDFEGLEDLNEIVEADLQASLVSLNNIAPGTIQGLLDHYLARIQIHFELNDRMDIVRMRSQLFSEYPATLQEVGHKFGVTRERIRQIMKKVEAFVIHDFESLPLLDAIVEIAQNSRSAEDYESRLSESALADGQKFCISQLKAICTAFGRSDLVDSILEAEENWLSNLAEQGEVVSKLRKIRGKSGLIDVQLFQETHELTNQEAVSIILKAYPRTIFFDRYCLSRTAKLTPITESVIYSLLKTFPDISIANLLIGLRRSSRKRGAGITLPDSALQALVETLAGSPPSSMNMRAEMLEEPTIDTHDSWLLATLSNSPRKFMHVSEILPLAIQDGLNLGSMSAYLSTSAFIYSPINHSGMFALINQNPDEQELRNHREIALSMQPENIIEHNFDGSELVLDLKLNIQSASGGSIAPPSEFLDLVRDSEFSLACSCGSLETDQILKVSKTFWFSISPFVRHLLECGIYKINSNMRVRLDFAAGSAILHHGTV